MAITTAVSAVGIGTSAEAAPNALVDWHNAQQLYGDMLEITTSAVNARHTDNVDDMMCVDVMTTAMEDANFAMMSAVENLSIKVVLKHPSQEVSAVGFIHKHLRDDRHDLQLSRDAMLRAQGACISNDVVAKYSGKFISDIDASQDLLAGYEIGR